MSRHTARNALDQISGKPAFLAPQYAGAPVLPEVTSNGLLADLRELSSAEPSVEEGRWQARKAELLSCYGYGDDPDDNKIFIFKNGKAFIPIHGLLINRFAYSWSFVTGYNFVRTQVIAAEADPEVDGIIFDVNSPGGMAAGCPETADLIAACEKPTIAVVDSNCFSAAYYIASQADKLVVTPSGSVGSVGVVMMHMDVSKALDEAGVKITFIKSGAHKTDGNPFEPLPDDVRARYQKECDAIYAPFVEAVARGRGLSEDDVRATEAECYLANDALDLGLVDDVQGPDEAITSFFSADPEQVEEDVHDDDDPDDPDNPKRSPQVAVQPNNRPGPTRQQPQSTQQAPTEADLAAAQAQAQADAAQAQAQAAADARASERTRIQGIQGHAEAVGREALANHLALNTDMTVEAAAGILAAAPKQTAAAAAAATAAPPATTEQGNHFANAMNNGQHPNVGPGPERTAEGGAGGGQVEQSAGSRILALQSRVTGVKPPVKDQQRSA